MSRYIDADALRQSEIERCRCVPLVGSNENNYKDLDDVLNDAPTADVVTVVRCKDCKYYTEHYETIWGVHGRCDHPEQTYETECDDQWLTTDPDDYCSYGERREV